MRPATAAERAQLREDLAELQSQYEKAVRQAAGNTLLNADRVALFLMPALSLLGVKDDNSRRVLNGLELERQQVALLAGDWRRWAEAGRRDNSTPYSFAQWQDQARTTSKSIRDWTGIGASRTAFVAVREAAADTVRTVEKAVAAVEDAMPDPKEREALLFWLKAGALALGAAVVLGGGAYVLNSLTGAVAVAKGTT
ncbi:hypothetical protein [Archangium sp.]|uniref:hypothetical protein n=1 Tax=Archangium sp. TaxID=1872627 RepID=UPI00286BC4B8|nr:hypothetical protein [Archangium sp.]